MGVIELVMSRIRWLADSYRFINAWAQVPIMCKLSYVDISIKQQPLCNKVLVHLFFLRICKYIIKIWSTYMNNDSSFHKTRRISTQWHYLGLAWSIYIRNKWNQSFFRNSYDGECPQLTTSNCTFTKHTYMRTEASHYNVPKQLFMKLGTVSLPYIRTHRHNSDRERRDLRGNTPLSPATPETRHRHERRR